MGLRQGTRRALFVTRHPATFGVVQSLFITYFELGFRHILDPQAYDHLLFLVALALPYRWQQWRPVLLLATAFTLGHSLTLALVGLEWVALPAAWVEFFIPVTIAATALIRLWKSGHPAAARVLPGTYVLVVLFGLVHGAGFSSLFRATALPGAAGEVGRQLLAFNLGVELGQLLIVLGILLASSVALSLLRVPYRWWLRSVGAGVLLLSIRLMIETFPL